MLNNNKNSDFCAPLTSFDWNEVDPNLVGTSSIDTTCTIWGLETGQMLGRVNLVSGHVKTQLIAHDKEVYDIAFSRAGKFNFRVDPRRCARRMTHAGGRRRNIKCFFRT